MTYLKFYTAALCVMVSSLLGSMASAHMNFQDDKYIKPVQDRINLASTQI